MADVRIYQRIDGQKFEKAIARMPGVQLKVAQAATDIMSSANTILSRYRDRGHSRVTMLRGRIDRYVVLDDTAGYGAAWKINEQHNVLGRAAGLRARGEKGISRGVGRRLRRFTGGRERQLRRSLLSGPKPRLRG